MCEREREHEIISKKTNGGGLTIARGKCLFTEPLMPVAQQAEQEVKKTIKSRCHVLPLISQVGRCKPDRGLIEIVVDVDVWVNVQVKLHIARSWNWI